MRMDAYEDDTLCCCEYINADGQRSHLLALCCNCAELDDACDRLIFSGRRVTEPQMSKLWRVVEDRLRVPWRGGAVRVAPELLLPPVAVPVLLRVSAAAGAGSVLLAVSHVLVALCLVVLQRGVLRWRPRTRFFLCWSATTAGYLFAVYQYHVVGLVSLQRAVSFLENLLLVSLLLGTLFLGQRARRSKRSASADGARFCRACDGYVVDKDHHCAWIDACVTRSNIGYFVGFLLCLILTAWQYAIIMLTSVCGGTDFLGNTSLLLPTDCSQFNRRFEGDPELVYVCGMHALVISVPLCLLLVKTAIDQLRRL